MPINFLWTCLNYLLFFWFWSVFLFPDNIGFSARYHVWKIWSWIFFPGRSCLCFKQAVKVKVPAEYKASSPFDLYQVSLLCESHSLLSVWLTLFCGVHNSLWGVLTESLGDLSRFLFFSELWTPVCIFLGLLECLEVLFSFAPSDTGFRLTSQPFKPPLVNWQMPSG